MYGIPANIDLSFFLKKTLLQVCFGAHDLILHFDGNVSITVTSSIGCQDSRGMNHKYVDFRQAASSILVLLNQTVLSAKVAASETLTLEFQEGGCLEIYDDSKQYESFTIRGPNGLIVV